jgi:hypothetical protein
MRKEE